MRAGLGLRSGKASVGNVRINLLSNGRKQTVTNTTHTNGSTEPSEKLKAIPSIADLDLRDYFAAKAMAAHAVAVSGVATKTPQDWHEMVAQMAYMTADALLAERNKQ